MYPYFIIQGHKVYAMGIGLAIAIVVFLFVGLFFAKRYKLQYSKLFFMIPLLLLLTYILGKRASLAFDMGIYIPFRSRKAFLSLLSPYGYHFHFVGLALGAIYTRRRFFKKIFLKSEKYKRVDTLFFSFAAALVPLGVFLLLGDSFIGKPTEAWFAVIPLLNDSSWIQYGRVYPLGIFISILAFFAFFVVFLAKKFLQSKYEKIRGYLGFSTIFFGLSVLYIVQIYARHGVARVWGYPVDIKNYMAFALGVYFLWKFLTSPKRKYAGGDKAD